MTAVSEEDWAAVIRILEHRFALNSGIWRATLELYGIADINGDRLTVPVEALQLHKLTMLCRQKHDNDQLSYADSCRLAAQALREGWRP